MRNKTLIIGCGRLGSSIANEISRKGEDAVIIDASKENFARLDDQFSGLTLAGDASVPETLEEAGIASASEIVIATGDDNVNLLVTFLACRKYHVPVIFSRFDDPDKALLIQGMPVKAIYPFQLSRSRYNTLKSGGQGE